MFAQFQLSFLLQETTNTFTYGGFSLVVWTGIFLGVLHTIMPCEDKAVICFYSFGVARDWKQALRILNFYGMGLFLMNLTIGTILSFFASIFGPYIREHMDRFTWNAISSFSLIISGIIMLIQLKHHSYWPHSEQLQELSENLGQLRARKRTAFLLGLLAGIPPCIFELAIYFHAMGFAIQYGWGNGVWTVFFFGLGTWIGLFPLIILGSMSGKLSKMLQKNSLRNVFSQMRNKKFNSEPRSSKSKSKSKSKSNLRLRGSKNKIKENKNRDPIEFDKKSKQLKKQPKKQKIDFRNELNNKDEIKKVEIDLSITPITITDEDLLDENGNNIKDESNKESNKQYSKIEFFSGAILILLGLIFLILALLRIDVFIWNEPLVPAPFSFLQK